MKQEILKRNRKMAWILSIVGLLVFMGSQPLSFAQGNVQKALIALSSANNDKLQCTCSVGGDGVMHANNQQVNQEESWWLWTVGDSSSHQVALQNYRNGYYMWRHPGGSSNHRVRMIHDIGAESTWTMIMGKDYGLPGNYVAFKAYDASYLKAWNGGGNSDAPGEGGEVYVDIGPPSSDPNWAGWWRMGQIGWTPTPGHDVWNTIGDGTNAILGKIYDALKFIFDGPTPAQNIPPPPPRFSCSSPPAVIRSTTDRWVHAFCRGVTPTDYPGPYYPSNDPFAAQRVQCDIDLHHKTQPSHNVVSVTCDAAARGTSDCRIRAHRPPALRAKPTRVRCLPNRAPPT